MEERIRQSFSTPEPNRVLDFRLWPRKQLPMKMLALPCARTKGRWTSGHVNRTVADHAIWSLDTAISDHATVYAVICTDGILDLNSIFNIYVTVYPDRVPKPWTLDLHLHHVYLHAISE